MISTLLLAATLAGAPQCKPDTPTTPTVAGLSLSQSGECCDDKSIDVDYAGTLGYYYMVCYSITCGLNTYKVCGAEQAPGTSAQITYTEAINTVYSGAFCDCTVTATIYEGIRIEGEIIWRDLSDTAISFDCVDPCN